MMPPTPEKRSSRAGDHRLPQPDRRLIVVLVPFLLSGSGSNPVSGAWAALAMALIAAARRRGKAG
jgi:MYXO-CTERM domain-containing protein